jgi:integrase
MLLAATGMRAIEALSIRIKDLDFDSRSAKVFVRGEYTKTRADRIVFLTAEVTQQLKSWLDYKYRTRRVCHKEEQRGKIITEHRTPDKKEQTWYLQFTKTKKCQILLIYIKSWSDLLQRH